MKMSFIVIYSLFCSFCFVYSDGNDVWNKNHRLRQKLLEKYDKHALPQKNVNGTTNVYVLLRPRALWIDDDEETLTVNSWMALIWKDKRLKWSPAEYGNLQRAHFGDNELWKPDLTVYNNADIKEIDHFGNTHFIVIKSGWVVWVPPARMNSYCPLDLTYWPFDEHNCSIIIGSWTSSGTQINLMLYNNRTKLGMRTYRNMSSSWYVKKATQKRNVMTFEGYNEFFVDIEFEFFLRRNMPSFSALVVVPSVMLPIMLLFLFILPVDHSKRFTIGCCCALLIVLELIFLKFSVPRLGNSTPLIVKYYSQCLVLVVLAVGLTAFLGRLCHPQDPIIAYPPPELLKRILKGPLATILFLRSHASKVGLSGQLEEDGEVLSNEAKTPSYTHEWLLVAKAADRLVIVIFILIFTFSLIGYVAPLK